jgi:integrase
MSSHLKLRGSTYYAQKRVPDDVRQAVGAQMLEKSLRTGDKAKANRAKLAVLAEWQEWFDSIRRGGDAAVRTPAELQQYANKLREEVASGRLRHVDAEETISGIVDNMAERATDEDAAGIRRARQALRGQLGPTLADESEAFLTERARDLRKQTIDDLRRHIGAFRKWAGDSFEVAAVDRKMAGRYVSEVIQRRDVSPSTRIKEVSALRTLFGHLMLRGLVEANPWDRMTASVKQSKRGKQAARRPWTEAELLTLVNGLDQSHPVWPLSVIALYSGARLNEVCSLTGTDYDASAGVVSVREGKSAAAVRSIPVHPVIVPLVAALARKAGSGPLLGKLSHGGSDNKPGHHISKRFGRDRKALKLDDPRIPFHALRKTFVSAALNAGSALSVVKTLVGHEQGEDVTLASYTDFALSTLRNAVDGVTFGAVDVAVSKIISEGFGQPELIAKA